jgi:hypothetical protein
MRSFFSRTLSAVLFFAFIFPTSFFGQSRNLNKPMPLSRKATPENSLLKAEEGPAVRVRQPIPKGRRGPSLGNMSEAGDPPPDERRGFRVTSRPRQGHLQRGRSFRGDLRSLSQAPPQRVERPEREEPTARPMLLPGTETPSPSQAAAEKLSSLPSR